ncbi:MAG: tyrosine-type recombinase/integrase [Solirubrobacteraceae bacterium]|jgi:integrase
MAEDFANEIERRLRLDGASGLDRGGRTLAQFIETWYDGHAPGLARSTLDVYAVAWERYILPELGRVTLRQLRPHVVEQFKREPIRRGVGNAMIAKTLTMLQSVLSYAVACGELDANPVREVRKPAHRPQRVVRPLTPEQVEAVRAQLDLRDATLISLLAYAGPRPAEALKLAWRDVRERTLVIEPANSKTGRGRTVRLLGPVAQDLAEWKLAQGPRFPTAPVFPRRDGRFWTVDDYRNWRSRVYRPVTRALGLPTQPYALRHSFVSLLIQEGRDFREVARLAGHGPEVCARTYAHLFDEWDGAERTSAEEAIRRARQARKAASG